MDAHDRSTLLEHLESGLREVLQALQKISDVAALHRTSSKQWSILDCVEHLVLTEDYLFARIQETAPSDKRVTNERREDAILSRGMDRTRVIESPVLAKPHGKFSSWLRPGKPLYRHVHGPSTSFELATRTSALRMRCTRFLEVSRVTK